MNNESVKIYKGNIIFTKTKDEFTIIENGYIVVNGKKVVDTFQFLPQQYQHLPVKDYGDRIIIPGFNDLHIHAAQYRNRGLCLDVPLIDWLFKCTFPEERKFSNLDYAREVYKIFIKDVWNAGNLRSLIYTSIHKESTMLLIEMINQAGLGAYVGKINMDLNAPKYLIENTEQSLLDTEEILRKYLNKYELINPIIAPRFVPSCSTILLSGLGQLAQKYNAKVMSHLSEELEEVKMVEEMYPYFPFYGSVYDYYGLFGQQPTVMAHCVNSTDEEIALMAKNGVYCAHCPTSNFNLGSGMMLARKFLDKGVPMGLGCDVSGGGDISLITVMNHAISVSKMIWLYSNKQLPALTPSESFYLATKGGGSFFGKVGSFEPGYDFDALVIRDRNAPIFDYNLKERIQQFIYIGKSANIEDRYIAGKLIEEPIFN